MRTMKKLRSVDVPTAPSSGSQKLGHPVRLSYFVAEENRGWSHPAQANVPARFSLSRGLLKARSVPWPRSTRYCSGVSAARQASSVFWTGKGFSATEPGDDGHQAQAGPGDGEELASALHLYRVTPDTGTPDSVTPDGVTPDSVTPDEGQGAVHLSDGPCRRSHLRACS